MKKHLLGVATSVVKLNEVLAEIENISCDDKEKTELRLEVTALMQRFTKMLNKNIEFTE